METLNKVEELAKELLNEVFTIKDYSGNTHNLSIRDIGYVFKFDNAKRRFGSCNYRYKVITISKHLCEANPHQIEGKIRDTLLHEMAHALSYYIYGSLGAGHGNRWKSISKQIGSNAKRCYSHSDFGGINRVESKWTGTCKSCEHTTGYHRKPKRKRSCGKCCSTYNEKFLLEITQNY